MWSSSRPGVATTTWGFPLRAAICLLMGSPPYTETIFSSGLKWARFRRSSVIWVHSSRVGQRTSACSSGEAGSTFSTMGMPKAQVLPVPVGALAMISRPSIITGMAFS